MLSALLALSYFTYLRALPRPLPGIAYNEAASRSILGDVPELLEQIRSRDLRGWFGALPHRLGSPMVQILGRPFSRPTLLVSDFPAAQDILLRRNREFDRPAAMLAGLRAVIPHHHISMLSSDPQFRRNKELVKDLMTPHFLHTVNAPEIWRSTARFVELWRLKARIAGGRPFDAAEDVSRTAFDIIKNVAVGRGENTMIEVYLDQILSEMGDGGSSTTTTSDKKDVAFQFPKPPYDETMEAQHRMNNALTPASALPPWLYHAINNRRSHMREAYASKDRLLRKQVELAVKRMEAGEPLESALDYMIQREIGASKKEARPPVFDSPYMFDERKCSLKCPSTTTYLTLVASTTGVSSLTTRQQTVYGYLGAGHDTTATTFQWGMKHLAQHPESQRQVRANLRAAHADAHAHDRLPSAAEIIKTPVPWLDAVIEEILRLSGPVGATARETNVDTTIMGRRVPKGTTVFLAIHGPGLTGPSVKDNMFSHAPGLVVGGGSDNDDDDDDQKQLPSSSSHTRRQNWDDVDPDAFIPERWLVTDEQGNVAYDAQAGPMLAFSLGMRGCFGRRLAYLTLRMLFTMLIWNFELDAVPDELDSWKAIQILTRKPVQCYVRLSEAK